MLVFFSQTIDCFFYLFRETLGKIKERGDLIESYFSLINSCMGMIEQIMDKIKYIVYLIREIIHFIKYIIRILINNSHLIIHCFLQIRGIVCFIKCIVGGRSPCGPR